MIEPVEIQSGEGNKHDRTSSNNIRRRSYTTRLGKIEIRKIQRYVDLALCRFSAM